MRLSDEEQDAQEVPMDKISGILPEKPRLRSDTEAMNPVRPGAPAFGRSEGSSEIRDRVSLSSVKNIGPDEFQNYRNPKEAKNVKIVDELSRKFFMTSAADRAQSSQRPQLPQEQRSSSLMQSTQPSVPSFDDARINQKVGTNSAGFRSEAPEVTVSAAEKSFMDQPADVMVESLDYYA